MLYFFLFVVGAVVGSFLGMLTYRLPRSLSIKGRSKCVLCGKKIRWQDNIPIFGYFLLKGKCRVCGKPYGLRYPLVELVTAIAFVIVGLTVNSLWEVVFLLVFTSLSLALLIVDLEHKILPDILTILLGILVVGFALAFPSPLLYYHVTAGFLSFIFFLLIYLVTGGRGMGFGDVKMVFVLGTLLGYPNALVWLFMSFLSGAIVGIVLLVLGRADFKHELAFGPYLLVAAWVTYIWGNDILRMYAGF